MIRPAAKLLATSALAATILMPGCSMMDSMTGGNSPHSQIARDLGMPTTTPEAVGFSTAGLDALTTEFRTLVETQKLAGVTTLVARHGRVVHVDTYGKQDASKDAPLRPDRIFRIASMTKPIAGVAMMQLWEQGKWTLSDPVSKFIPEFANLQVKKPGGGTEPQRSPMTMAQLMSHSAGFGVSAVYTEASLGATELQGMVDKLKNLPLETQPGTVWDYGPSVDIQGYIIETLSGQPLDAYLYEHIFKPLGMVDTGFWVPEDKASRGVAIQTYESEGKIKGPEQNSVRTSRPSFLSGSGGLLSKVEDYWRFAQTIANGGQLDGKRVLREDTIKLMRTNVLPPSAKVDLYGPSQEGVGFGLDFAIIMDPQRATTPQGLNTFYWGGAYGTWFWIDTMNDIVFVGMIQNLNGSRPDGGTPRTRQISPRLVYAALTDRSK